MNNKYSKTIRLNEEEYNMLMKYSTKNNISISDSIRESIRSLDCSQPKKSKQNKEIVRSFCSIHALLDEQGIYDEDIEKEFQKICQILS